MIRYRPIETASGAEAILSRYCGFENAAVTDVSFVRGRGRNGENVSADLTLTLSVPDADGNDDTVSLLFTGVTGASLPDLAAAETLFSLRFTVDPESGEIICMEDPEQDPEDGLMITASGLFVGKDEIPRRDRNNPLFRTDNGAVDYILCDENTLCRVETVYGVTLPGTLRNYYLSYGFPRERNEGRRPGFPHWYDFSPETVKENRRKMSAPYRFLKAEALDWYWNPAWGKKPASEEEAARVFDEKASEAPKLFPFFGHRYLPLIDGIGDPPVLSSVGSDTIVYGKDFQSYLNAEFAGAEIDGGTDLTLLPFWDSIIG